MISISFYFNIFKVAYRAKWFGKLKHLTEPNKTNIAELDNRAITKQWIAACSAATNGTANRSCSAQRWLEQRLDNTFGGTGAPVENFGAVSAGACADDTPALESGRVSASGFQQRGSGDRSRLNCMLRREGRQLRARCGVTLTRSLHVSCFVSRRIK